MHTTKKQEKKDARTTTLEEEECTPQQCESCNVQNHKLRSCSSAPDTQTRQHRRHNKYTPTLPLFERAHIHRVQAEHILLDDIHWMFIELCGFFFICRFPRWQLAAGACSWHNGSRYKQRSGGSRPSVGFETERQIWAAVIPLPVEPCVNRTAGYDLTALKPPLKEAVPLWPLFYQIQTLMFKK